MIRWYRTGVAMSGPHGMLQENPIWPTVSRRSYTDSNSTGRNALLYIGEEKMLRCSLRMSRKPAFPATKQESHGAGQRLSALSVVSPCWQTAPKGKNWRPTSLLPFARYRPVPSGQFLGDPVLVTRALGPVTTSFELGLMSDSRLPRPTRRAPEFWGLMGEIGVPDKSLPCLPTIPIRG